MGRYLPLFFCNQKKSRKTVKEKFRPLPSRSRVRLPPKGGINAPPETERFLISTASPMGSRAVFQYPSGARPPKVLRTSRGYYFDSSAKGAHSARRLSRDWQGEGAPAPCAEINCFGEEDSNERNPSGVRFSSSRLCSAKARRGHSRAEHGIAKVQSAVKPAFGGLPSSVTVQRKSAAPRHLPQGEGVALPRRAQNLLSAGAESGGLRSICRKVRRKPVRSPKNFLFCGVLGGSGLIITENSGIIKFTRREAPSYKMYFMRKSQYNY